MSVAYDRETREQNETRGELFGLGGGAAAAVVTFKKLKNFFGERAVKDAFRETSTFVSDERAKTILSNAEDSFGWIRRSHRQAKNLINKLPWDSADDKTFWDSFKKLPKKVQNVYVEQGWKTESTKTKLGVFAATTAVAFLVYKGFKALFTDKDEQPDVYGPIQPSQYAPPRAALSARPGTAAYTMDASETPDYGDTLRVDHTQLEQAREAARALSAENGRPR